MQRMGLPGVGLLPTTGALIDSRKGPARPLQESLAGSQDEAPHRGETLGAREAIDLSKIFSNYLPPRLPLQCFTA